MSQSAVTLYRPLDTNEAIFYVFDNQNAACRTAQALRLAGNLNEDVLREALRRLSVLHERLRCRIVDTVDGPVWQADDSAPVLRVLAPQRFGEAERVVGEALKGTSTSPHWWVEWAPQASAHLLCLILHHSVADGVSAVRLSVDLVNLINDVIGGRPLRQPLAPAPSLDQALPLVSQRQQIVHRLGRLRARVLRKPTTLLALDGRAGVAERETRMIFDTISEATISALRCCAASASATVGGALTAAVIRAIGIVDRRREAVDVSTQISLRAQCDPPIPSNAVGCYGGRSLTRHEPTQSFWQLARTCTKSVRRAIRRGESYVPLIRTRGKVDSVAAALSRLVDNRDNLGRTCALAISNLGLMMVPEDNGPVRLTGFYPAIANHPTGASLQLSCGTLQGELQCSWMYITPLISDDRARKIWRAVRNELEEAIRS